MTPCSTREQRWSACRARVYATGFDWLRYNKPCASWADVAPLACHRRPCTSPRRRQCRAGTWVAAHHVHCVCPALEIGPVQQRMYVPIVGGRWDWFNAVLPGD